jgi:hypothetical protein
MEQASYLRQYFDLVTQDFNSLLGYSKTGSSNFTRPNWINNFYEHHNPALRHAHLQYYKTDRIGIVHLNIFPHPTIDYPILGADLIEIGGKITGFFFDVTPIDKNQIIQKTLIQFKNSLKSPERKLPEWANFFSDNFICVTPQESEIDYIMSNSRYIIRDYLINLKTYKDKYSLNIKKQNDYCKGQKKNDKTFKSLAADIGDKEAKDFLNNFMFPEL